MVTYIPVGGGASEMAVGGKLNPNSYRPFRAVSCRRISMLQDDSIQLTHKQQ